MIVTTAAGTEFVTCDECGAWERPDGTTLHAKRCSIGRPIREAAAAEAAAEAAAKAERKAARASRRAPSAGTRTRRLRHDKSNIEEVERAPGPVPIARRPFTDPHGLMRSSD